MDRGSGLARWSRRRRWVVGMAGLLGAILVVGALLVRSAAARPDPSGADPTGADVKLTAMSTLQSVQLLGKTISLQVPDSLGTPQEKTLPYSSKCVADRVVWTPIPQGSSDHRPLLVLATTGLAPGGGPAPGCPTESALNGRFPGWGSSAEAPADARVVPVSAPIARAVRFPLTYTQCTNECYNRTYAVTVVDFLDPTAGSLWIQSWGIPEDRLDAMLASLRVS